MVFHIRCTELFRTISTASRVFCVSEREEGRKGGSEEERERERKGGRERKRGREREDGKERERKGGREREEKREEREKEEVTDCSTMILMRS